MLVTVRALLHLRYFLKAAVLHHFPSRVKQELWMEDNEPQKALTLRACPWKLAFRSITSREGPCLWLMCGRPVNLHRVTFPVRSIFPFSIMRNVRGWVRFTSSNRRKRR